MVSTKTSKHNKAWRAREPRFERKIIQNMPISDGRRVAYKPTRVSTSGIGPRQQKGLHLKLYQRSMARIMEKEEHTRRMSHQASRMLEMVSKTTRPTLGHTVDKAFSGSRMFDRKFVAQEARLRRKARSVPLADTEKTRRRPQPVMPSRTVGNNLRMRVFNSFADDRVLLSSHEMNSLAHATHGNTPMQLKHALEFADHRVGCDRDGAPDRSQDDGNHQP